MERKLIIGYDPEHGGADVLRLGRLFAETLAMKPTVLAALPWPAHLLGPDDLQKQVDGAMSERFAVVREELADLDPELRAVASPSAAKALHELAESDDVQLLVLGSSHHGRIGRTLVGSVGESLAHGAPCAIAVAPHGYAAREQHALKRIAVAFDGSPEAEAALATAVGIADRSGGALVLIAVADYPRYGYATEWSILSGEGLHDREREDKERLLASALGQIPAALESSGRVESGDAAAKLAEASAEFDLMVVGSRAYGPVRTTLLGSTTRKLIRNCACPVLVLPRGTGPDPLAMR